MPHIGFKLYVAVAFFLSTRVLIAADITPSPSPLSFGTVYLNATGTLTVTLTNTDTKKDVSNLSVNAAFSEPFGYYGGSFPGTGATCATSTVLSPGGSCTIILRFLPTSVGSFNGTLSLNYKLQNQSKTFSATVTGTGALSPAAFSISNTSYNFYSWATGTSGSESFTLTNTGQTTANSISATNPLGAFSWKGGSYPGTGGTCSSSLAGGSSCNVVIAFSPTNTQSYSSSFSLSATSVSAVTTTLSGSGISAQTSGNTNTSFGNAGTASLDTGASTSQFITSVGKVGNTNLFGGGFAYSTANSNNDFAVSKFTADGLPDTAFNSTGVKTIDLGGQDIFTNVIGTSSGGVFATGFSKNDFAVVKLTSTGALDTSFSGTGVSTISLNGPDSDDFAYASLLQSDGKLILIGSSFKDGLYRVALTRQTTTGALDATFGTGGITLQQVGSSNSFAYAAQFDSSNKIVLVGTAFNGSNYDFMVARFNTNGTLDTTFNSPNGYRLVDIASNTADLANALAINSSDEIFLSGRVLNSSDQVTFGVAKVKSDGAIDTTFATSGKYRDSMQSGKDSLRTSIAIAPTTNDLFVSWYVATNSSPVYVKITNLTSSGAIRSTYGTSGTLTTNIKMVTGQTAPITFTPAGNLVLGGREVTNNYLALKSLW